MKMNSKTIVASRGNDAESASHDLNSPGSMSGARSDQSVNAKGILKDAVVNKFDRREVVSGASIPGAWQPQHPEIGIEKLWPSAIALDTITLQKAPYRCSTDIAQLLRSKGDNVDTIPFKHYRANTYVGQPRLLNNSDCLKGKEPIYGDLSNFDKVRHFLKDLVKRMTSHYQSQSTLVSKCEMEDLPKICMQQWKQPGWYLDSPITDADVPPMSDRNRDVIRRIARAYKQHLPKEVDTEDFRSLCLMDYDPDDTMTGSPTYASGEQTHEARLADLLSAPVPGCDPDLWYQRLLARQSQIGWPDPCSYSPVVSTRFGPRVKPMRLWFGSDAYMESVYEAIGAYNRVRLVYPAPYLLNYLWSATYKQLSSVRKCIPGLWHDPVSQEKYISLLQRQGHLPYSVDFTGMDTGMYPEIILMIVEALLDAGFCSWPLKMMKEIYPHMGIIFPCLEGGIENVSVITGPARPWCSGFKLTSEFDTLYGLAVILDCLDQLRPGTLDAWCNGSWTIAELGDDIIFTTAHEIDVDKLQELALKNWGAKLKVNRDLMFLKWILPLNGEVKAKARTFARTIQQTFYNEDRYSGIEGGDRPPCILRMALKARTIGLKNHPDYSLWMPELIKGFSMLPFVQQGGSQFINEVILGDKLALDSDMAEIYNYARKQPGYFLGLAERAKYEPSASQLLSLWQEMKVPIDQTPALEIRKIYDRALFTEPTPQSIETLMRYTNQAVL